MKKIIYFILLFVSLRVAAGVPVPQVEQQYLRMLARSFTPARITPPRTPLYWSLCLGSNSKLSTEQLNLRIAHLLNDSTARLAFYKRLNYYGGIDNWACKGGTTSVILPTGNSNKKVAKKDAGLIPVLSDKEHRITVADWQAYENYINSFGEDQTLAAIWAGCGPVFDTTTGGKQERSATTDSILTFADEVPYFEGGDNAMLNFFTENIQYPEWERDNDKEGKVLVRFIVCPDGHASRGVVIRHVSPGLDSESILMVKMLPLFKPGKEAGKTVAVYYNLPFVFRLQ